MSRSFRIGTDSTEHLAVEVLAREHPDKSDYWDGNWLTAMIDVASGPWHGTTAQPCGPRNSSTFATSCTG